MVDQYKQQLDSVMQREVSRFEFLQFVGVAFLGVVGIAGFFKHLHHAVPDKNAKAQSPLGYGRSKYGR